MDEHKNKESNKVKEQIRQIINNLRPILDDAAYERVYNIALLAEKDVKKMKLLLTLYQLILRKAHVMGMGKLTEKEVVALLEKLSERVEKKTTFKFIRK